jgi:hypothetical protein
MSCSSSQRTAGISSSHITSFSNLKVSDLRNTRAIFRVLHDQPICQETLLWHRLWILYGNVVVRLVVKASWYHLCEPIAMAPCNVTALQKAVNMVNPAVMQQNAWKIGLTLGYLQSNKVNSYPRPIHKLNHSSHAYLAYPVLRNTFSNIPWKL